VVEVEPEPWVGRGGDRRLPESRLSPSPGSGEAEFVVFRGRGRVRALGSGEAEFVVFWGRGRVRALGSVEAELPMAPEAGLGCCQPHSVEWHSSRSGAGGAVLLSGRSVERRSDCGHFVSGTIIRGTLKAPNSQLVTPISIKLQRPDGCDQVRDQSIRGTRSRLARA
jgi:hypothetical protein